MEERVPADEIGLLLEDQAALGLHCFEDGQALEPAVGERLVGQGPEMLGWLQFRRIGWQDHHVDALGDLHSLPGMPAGAIKHEDNPLRRSGSHIPGKGSEHLPKEGSGDGRQEPPLGLARRRTDKATEVEPFVALLHRSGGALPDRCPHLSDERQEPNPMLVDGPELDLGSRMLRSDRRYLVGELC